MSNRQFRYISLLFFLVVFLITWFRPVEYFPDSQDYLQMDIYRSATYPLFLALLKTIFGNYFENALVISQAIIGFLSIYFLIKTIKKILIINSWWLLLLTIILLLPYVYNLNIANRILSEALAYPLYLTVVSHFLIAFLNSNKKNLQYGLLFLFLLIQTRSQFMFLIPIGLLILIWISIEQKKLKQHLGLIILFIIFPLLMSTVDKTFHKIAHGYYVNTPWTGICIITPGFFVAHESDYEIYDNQNERNFFKLIYNQLQQKGLNIHHLDSSVHDKASFYIDNYSKIANRTVCDEGKLFVGNHLSENEKYIALDELTIKMTYPLILNNFKEWLKLYIKNYINAFGNGKNCLLFFMLLFFGLYGLVKYKTPKFKLITLLLLLSISNPALVAIGMHTIKRFTFYNDWVIFLTLIILMDTLFKMSRINEK